MKPELDELSAVSAIDGRYAGATDTIAPCWTPPVDSIHGLDAPIGYGALIASFRYDACPSTSNGIIRFDTVTLQSSIYVITCPGPVADDPARGRFYYVDAGANPQKVLGIEGESGFGVAELPSGTSASDMALYAPEPSQTLAASISLLVLAAMRIRILRKS